jgi:PAS domain S-box-containing protein
MAVTQQQLIQGNFKSTNDLYLRMIEEVQDYAIILMDKEGIIRNWNKGAEKIKQYTASEIIGRHFSIFYWPEDLACNLPDRLIDEASRTGRASHEGWRKRKDGSRFWGSITITALHDDDNEIVGFSKVTRDLTEKKINEDNLRLSEERYHRMIAEVQDYAIILLSPEGIIENWNTGAEKIKGYSAGEVVGKKFDMFYTNEDCTNGLPDRLLNKARETGRATQEGWRVRKGGTKFWGTIVITALHSKDGRLIGFSKVTRDLTEKKIAEEKMLAYTAELEIQNSELEQFAYVASHDLQEPLRKIRTFAELIQDNYGDEAFVKKYFQKLDSSAKRMAQLIKSLLEYSRLAKETGKGDLIRQKTDLNTILIEVRQDFELLIEEKEATINSEILPTINGNYFQLGQLFSNLISNSLKFSNTKPVINISAATIDKNKIPHAPSTLKNGKYYRISFEDNGIGFEQKYDKIIFSLFQRLHGKHDYAGTGIGLALCKKIADNHGGTINASSSLGKGAKFDLYLPLS